MIRDTARSRIARRVAVYLAGVTLISLFAGCRPSVPDLSPTPTVQPVHRFRALLTDANAKVTWGGDPVSREIMKRTGVELDLEILTGDLTQRISTYIASDSYPDLLLSIDNDSVARLAQAGALVPLDELISTRGTNIRAVFGDDLNRMRDEKNGRIYGLNRSYGAVPTQSQAVFHIQYEMLEKTGFPRLKTLADLMDTMIAYRRLVPDFQGAPLIGLTAWGDSYGMNVTFNNPALAAAGYQNDGNFAILPDFQVAYGATLPTSKRYFHWLFQLNQAGLFDAESLVQNRDRFFGKVSSGRVLVATTEYWDLGDSQAALRSSGLENRCFAPFPLLLDEGMTSAISNYDPSGNWKSVITKDCPEPDAAFDFFDAMWSEPMQILCNWGVEGIDYDIVDGKRVMRAEIVDARQREPDWRSRTGLQIYGFWSQGDNVLDNTGQSISPFANEDLLAANRDPAEQKVLDAFGLADWTKFCPLGQPSPWGFAWTLTLPQDSPGAYAERNVNDILRRNHLPKIILASNEARFEEEWQSFVQAVDTAGIHLREEEISSALRKRAELWSTLPK